MHFSKFKFKAFIQINIFKTFLLNLKVFKTKIANFIKQITNTYLGFYIFDTERSEEAIVVYDIYFDFLGNNCFKYFIFIVR